MYPSPWKIRPISLDIPMIHFSLSGFFIRCRYFRECLVLGNMNVFTLPGFTVRLPFAWSITAQSSPDGRTRGAGLLVVEVGVFFGCHMVCHEFLSLEAT